MRTLPDRNPPESKEKPLRIQDLSGGQKTAISSTLLKDKEMQKAENVSFSLRGAIKLREVFKNRYDTTFSSRGIAGLGGFFKTDGTTRLVMAVDDKLYYDKPHYEKRYSEQHEFEEGITTYLSLVDPVGSMVLDAEGAIESYSKTFNLEADFDEGTYDACIAVEDNSLVLTYPDPTTLIKTTTADFTGTAVNIDINDGIRLHSDADFDFYVGMTFDDLIAL